MPSIETILESIDLATNIRLDERQVAKHIDLFIKSSQNKVDDNIQWEKAAFEFFPNYSNKKTGWGTYFGPMYIWPNEHGQLVEYPSIQMLSEYILDYYTHRATQARNPILIARYYGIVYDFYHKITGKSTPYSVKIGYVKALVYTASGGYYLTPINTVEKLRRAIEIATLLNNVELIEECKKAIISFENNTAEDKFAGLWGYAFDLLLIKGRKKIKLEDSEEKFLVQAMVDRFCRLISSEDDEQYFFRNSEFAAKYLAKYYRTKGELETTRFYIGQVTNAIYKVVQQEASGAKAVAEYERLYRLTTEFGLNEFAKKYLLKIRELGRKTHDEMSVFSFEHSISRDELNIFAGAILKGSPAEKILKIAHYFVPDFRSVEKSIKADYNENPIRYVVTQRLMDRKGRAQAILGPIESDLEGHIFYYLYRILKINVAPYLNFVLHQVKSNMEFDKNDILNAFEGSPVVSPTRLEIIAAGLDAYFENNYLVAIHLLIPQIEEALRNCLVLK